MPGRHCMPGIIACCSCRLSVSLLSFLLFSVLSGKLEVYNKYHKSPWKEQLLALVSVHCAVVVLGLHCACMFTFLSGYLQRPLLFVCGPTVFLHGGYSSFLRPRSKGILQDSFSLLIPALPSFLFFFSPQKLIHQVLLIQPSPL